MNQAEKAFGENDCSPKPTAENLILFSQYSILNQLLDLEHEYIMVNGFGRFWWLISLKSSGHTRRLRDVIVDHNSCTGTSLLRLVGESIIGSRHENLHLLKNRQPLPGCFLIWK